jgi:TM2 domain-containing membrane protein YozV
LAVPVCRQCGSKTLGLRCRWCGAKRDTRTILKAYVLPPFLSMLIPGLGQLVKKRPARALGVFATFLVSAFLIMSALGWFLIPTVWFLNVVDAYQLE